LNKIAARRGRKAAEAVHLEQVRNTFTCEYRLVLPRSLGVIGPARVSAVIVAHEHDPISFDHTYLSVHVRARVSVCKHALFLKQVQRELAVELETLKRQNLNQRKRHLGQPMFNHLEVCRKQFSGQIIAFSCLAQLFYCDALWKAFAIILCAFPPRLSIFRTSTTAIISTINTSTYSSDGADQPTVAMVLASNYSSLLDSQEMGSWWLLGHFTVMENNEGAITSSSLSEHVF
jgi:hypothetical protein